MSVAYVWGAYVLGFCSTLGAFGLGDYVRDLRSGGLGLGAFVQGVCGLWVYVRWILP